MQLLALLQDGLWLDLARHANTMARRLASGVSTLGLSAALPVDINEVFLEFDRSIANHLRTDGFEFHAWGAEPAQGACVYRFVTSFATEPADIDAFLAGLKRTQG